MNSTSTPRGYVSAMDGNPPVSRSSSQPGAAIYRVLKDALAFLYLWCGFVPVRDLVLSLLGRSRAVIVYYHRIGGRDQLSKPADAFRRDLEYFKRWYECISLSELCRRLRAGEPLRRRCVVVTFDDGYRDNYTTAFPLLQAAGIPALFYVSTGFVGTDKVFPHDERAQRDGLDFPKLTWDDVRALAAAGHEIGSHTVNHVNLGKCQQQTVQEELGRSLADLERELGPGPRHFSFPWGKPGDFTEEAIELARRLGCVSAATAYGGWNSRGTDPFHLLRMDVGNGYLSGLNVQARVAGLQPDFWRALRKLGRPGR